MISKCVEQQSVNRNIKPSEKPHLNFVETRDASQQLPSLQADPLLNPPATNMHTVFYTNESRLIYPQKLMRGASQAQGKSFQRFLRSTGVTEPLIIVF